MENSEKEALLTEAINNRYPITFQYKESNWEISNREWNPHVLYLYKAKNWSMSIKLWIFQTWWESTSWLNKFKDFLSLNNIDNILVLKDTKFNIDEIYYKSDSPRYNNPLAKI